MAKAAITSVSHDHMIAHCFCPNKYMMLANYMFCIELYISDIWITSNNLITDSSKL